MRTSKLIGCWGVCAMLLSLGVLYAQEDEINVPKSDAPIEVAEQKGTVLGSLQKTVNQFPLPSVTVNTGFQTKQFKRGVMWDQNTNADVDISLRWYPTENSSLSIGLNGRAPTRNSRRKYYETIRDESYYQQMTNFFYLDYGSFFFDYWYNQIPYNGIETAMSITRTKGINTSLKSQREENEFDEREIRIDYTYTFKDVPIVNDISVTGGWSFFKENDIYAKIKSKFYLGNVIAEFFDGFYDFYNKDLSFYKDVYTFASATKNVIVESYAAAEIEALQNVANIDNVMTILGIESLNDLSDLQRQTLINMLLTEEERKNLLIRQTNIYNAWVNTVAQLLGGSGPFIQDLAEGIDYYEIGNYDYKVDREIKWRNASRHEFKIGLSLDNILDSNTYTLNPNMSINFETTGHVWMQYGVNFSMPLEKLSKKLTWNTSIDTYWFDHDYFKVSDRFHFYYERTDREIDMKTYQIGDDWRQRIEKRIQKRMSELDKEYSKTAHSPSGFKTLSLRTSIDYAFRPNIIISPNVSAIHYLNDLLEHSDYNDAYYFDNHYVFWCGINLLFTF